MMVMTLFLILTNIKMMLMIHVDLLQSSIQFSAHTLTFPKKNITVDQSCLIIFSRPEQLDFLVNTKTLYLDGTLKVIRTKDIFSSCRVLGRKTTEARTTCLCPKDPKTEER